MWTILTWQAVQGLHRPPMLWVCGHIHESVGEHRVPHPRAEGGSILLINAATNNLKNGDERAAPRSVQLKAGMAPVVKAGPGSEIAQQDGQTGSDPSTGRGLLGSVWKAVTDFVI